MGLIRVTASSRWGPIGLFVIGFLLFLASFGQKAVVVDDLPIRVQRVETGFLVQSVGGPISGWRAAKRHWPTWPLNLALAHLPIVLTLMHGFGLRRLRWLGAAIAGVAFCGQAIIGLFPSMNHITELRAGYFMWTASSLLMCGAFLMAGRSAGIRAEPAPGGRVCPDEGDETGR